MARPEDILQPEGFVRMIAATLQLKEGGLLAVAMVCSTFCLVNRALSALNEVMPVGTGVPVLRGQLYVCAA